jgi:hypothetical protein
MVSVPLEELILHFKLDDHYTEDLFVEKFTKILSIPECDHFSWQKQLDLITYSYRSAENKDCRSLLREVLKMSKQDEYFLGLRHLVHLILKE